MVEGCKTTLTISNKPWVVIPAFCSVSTIAPVRWAVQEGCWEDSAEFKDDLALAYCPNSPLPPNLTVKRTTQKGFSEAEPTMRIQARRILQGYPEQ